VRWNAPVFLEFSQPTTAQDLFMGIKVSKIRELHKHLTEALAYHDAQKSGESESEDGSGSGLGARNLEESDQAGSQDDEDAGPPETPVTRADPSLTATS
jgi:hypothetical protein